MADDYEIIGPFAGYKVTVHGRQVPFLEAMPVNGGKIGLVLDQRYGVDIPVADAGRIIPFIADCIAVALGYTCHPHAAESLEASLEAAAEERRRGAAPRSDPFPQMHGITSVQTERDDPVEDGQQ